MVRIKGYPVSETLHLVKQQLSNFRMHQNHLAGLLKTQTSAPSLYPLSN